MSRSYRNRKKAMRSAVIAHFDEAWLRAKMKRDPDNYPRWLFGISLLIPAKNTFLGGPEPEHRVLIQKVFPNKGTYTAKAGGKEKHQVKIQSTYPCISTVAFYRSQQRAKD